MPDLFLKIPKKSYSSIFGIFLRNNTYFSRPQGFFIIFLKYSYSIFDDVQGQRSSYVADLVNSAYKCDTLSPRCHGLKLSIVLVNNF